MLLCWVWVWLLLLLVLCLIARCRSYWRSCRVDVFDRRENQEHNPHVISVRIFSPVVLLDIVLSLSLACHVAHFSVSGLWTAVFASPRFC